MQVLRIYDLVEMFGCCRQTIWRRIRRGELPEPRRLGKRPVWLPEDLERAGARGEPMSDGS